MITSKATKQVRVLGGTNTEMLKILNGSSFDNWASSVEGNMHVVDLTNGLMPITDLIVDRTRRERVAQELRAVMESTDGIPLPYLKPVQAYHNGKSKSWFFSPRQDDIPTGFGPSSYEGARFFVYEEKRGEAVQFYRMQAGEKPLYMLTPDPTPRNGWVDPVPVFYAYRSDGPNRVPVYSYQHTKAPEKYGWFYNTKQKVFGWSRTSENSFFAPTA